MKRILVAVLLCSSAVFAQEIGNEITPAPKPNDNPYAGNNSGAANNNTPPPPPLNLKGAPLSAGAGAFGIRAGFGGGNLVGGSGFGNAGINYFATENVALLIDLGFGLATAGNNVNVGFGVGFGIDYHARTAFDALRPSFRIQGAFNLTTAGNNVAPGVSIGIGGGADYFFSPNFSVGGRLMLIVPMVFANNVTFGLFTLSPGIEATWYF